MLNFDEATNKAQAEYGKTGDRGGDTEWFKLVEGDNKLRVLSMPEAYGQHYKPGFYCGICVGKANGCPGCIEADKEEDPKKKNKVSVKYLVWVLDHKDDKIKLFKAAYGIIQQIQTLASSDDYAFTEMPMPFDININAKGAGSLDVKYTLMPGRINSELPTEVLEKLAKEQTVTAIKEKMKEKKLKELGVANQHNPQDDEPTTDPDYNENDIYDGVDEQ